VAKKTTKTHAVTADKWDGLQSKELEPQRTCLVSKRYVLGDRHVQPSLLNSIVLRSHSAQMLVPFFYQRYPQDLYLVVTEEERTSCLKKKCSWLVFRWWKCQISISTLAALTEILWFFVVPLRTSRKTTKPQYRLCISFLVYYSIFIQ
jgi:hypothetical protein